MAEAKVSEIYTIRGRPVGYAPDSWGGSFVAVERGYFPVSPTGYRSCTGFARREITPAEKQTVLEKLAEELDRERASLLKRLGEGAKPEADPVLNYIHASMTYEKALADGFFATDHQRSELWSGAHRMLCVVLDDRRYQPAVAAKYPAWNGDHCAAAMDFARKLHASLVRWAGGDFSETPPLRLLGAQGYFQLPARPDGEPRVDLGAHTAELALDAPVAVATRPPKRRHTEGTRPTPSNPGTQLGLFETAVSTPTPELPADPGVQRMTP